MKPVAAAGLFLATLWLCPALACASDAPAPPIAPELEKAAHERWGYIVFADDTRVDGLVSTTRDKPLRIFDRKKSSYRDIKFEKVQTVEQAPDREWLEEEWRWKEGGNDEKVYTGRFYRAAEYRTVITLKDGESITGDVVAPIYVKTAKERLAFELHQRFKSPEPAAKKDLKPLSYIKKVVLTDEPPKPKDAGSEKK